MNRLQKNPKGLPVDKISIVMPTVLVPKESRM